MAAGGTSARGSATGASSGGFLPNIQVLRFLAAAMVLVGHVQHEASELGIAGDGFTPFVPVNWGVGVDVFFVISGFIMFYMCHDLFGAEGEARRFLLRRAVRLVPTYWLFTGLMLVATLLFASQLAHPDIDPAHVLASLVFLPWPNPAGATVPFLILGWTLNFEVLFYVVFALALTLPRRAGLALVFAVFIGAALLHPLVPERFHALAFWTRPIILEFLMGIGLAAAFLRGWRTGWAGSAALVAGGVGALVLLEVVGWYPDALRFLWGGVPALAICAGLALAPERSDASAIGRWAVIGGTASYALYLSHPFTINALGLVWRKLGLGAPWAFVAVACLVSIAVSVAVYYLVEHPAVTWLGRRLRPRPRQPVPAQ